MLGDWSFYYSPSLHVHVMSYYKMMTSIHSTIFVCIQYIYSVSTHYKQFVTCQHTVCTFSVYFILLEGAVTGCDFCFYFLTTYNISAPPAVCNSGCSLGIFGSCLGLLSTSLGIVFSWGSLSSVEDYWASGLTTSSIFLIIVLKENIVLSWRLLCSAGDHHLQLRIRFFSWGLCSSAKD